MNYYRTSQPEKTATALCQKNKLVVALQWLILPRRIPLRLSAIEGAQIYHVRRKADGENNVKLWRRTGGLYVREYSGRPDYGHTEATLRVEAPVDLTSMEQETAHCSGDFVINEPLRWDIHRNALIDLFPPSEIARRFWHTLEIFRARRPRNIDLAMLKIMELPEETVCIPKTEFYKKANLSVHQMNRIAGKASKLIDQKRTGYYCTPVTLRFEPEKPDYLALYKWIEQNCRRYMQYHVIINGEPGAKFPYWKHQLRMMHLSQHVQREDEINFWAPNGMQPEYERYDEEFEAAKARLEDVISFVKGLPEYPALARAA